MNRPCLPIVMTLTLTFTLTACGLAQTLIDSKPGSSERAAPAPTQPQPKTEPQPAPPAAMTFVPEEPLPAAVSGHIGRVVFTAGPDDGADPTRFAASIPFSGPLHYRVVAARSRENLIRQATGHVCRERLEEMRFIEVDGHPVPFPDQKEKPYAYFVAPVPEQEWSSKTTWQSEDLIGWRAPGPFPKARDAFRDDVFAWLSPGKHTVSVRIVARCEGRKPGGDYSNSTRTTVAEGSVEIVVAAADPARYIKATYEADRFRTALSEPQVKADVTRFAELNAKYKDLTLRGLYPRGPWVPVRNDLGILTHRAVTMDLVFAPAPGQSACRHGIVELEAPHLAGGRFDRVQVGRAIEPVWINCAVMRGR